MTSKEHKGVIRKGSPLDRVQGCLLGLAVGDALGAAVEFAARGTFEPVTGMRGGGPHGLPPGYWTDDTSMALCLADSLLDKGGFDPVDQLERYARWWRDGERSSTGVCFDIGNTVLQALARFERTGESYPGPTDPRRAGNGSIMRLAPVALFYAGRPREAIEHAALSSRTTHGALEAVDACRFLCGLLVGALRGEPKARLLAPRFSPVPGLWEEHGLAPRIDAIARGSYKARDAQAIRSSGYVVDTLEAALWAFYRTDSFEEGALLAVNLGGDADTVGAVYGQIAGAFYGACGIPKEWLDSLYARDEIASIARDLWGASNLAG